MFEKRRAILSHLLKRRFEMELQLWTNALKHNFDVAVVCQSVELQLLLVDYLACQKNLPARVQFISTPSESRAEAPIVHPSMLQPDNTTVRERVVYVAFRQVPRGCAAVVFELQPLESLLPSAATMITMLLNAAGLERFLDAFDAHKLSQLKRIIEKAGINDFFDAVIQVAYIVGFRGDEGEASDYLEQVLSRATESAEQTQHFPEKRTTSLEKLFEQLIELPDPHDTLKAALAHYVFHGRRVTQAEASRILKVSRSTLQSHLQLAERLKVATYFSHQRNHA